MVFQSAGVGNPIKPCPVMVFWMRHVKILPYRTKVLFLQDLQGFKDSARKSLFQIEDLPIPLPTNGLRHESREHIVNWKSKERLFPLQQLSYVGHVCPLGVHGSMAHTQQAQESDGH